MNVSDALNSRFTCRAFNENPVDKDVVIKILEDATHSPSWANTQPWEIYVATGEVLETIKTAYLEHFNHEMPRVPDVSLATKWPEEHKKRIKELGYGMYKHMKIDRDDDEARNASWKRNFQFFGASTVIYLCMDHKLGEWSMFDLGSLSQSIMLAAKGIGVDSAVAINLVVYPDILRNELNIPKNLSIVIGIAIGYKDDDDPQTRFKSNRRPLKEVINCHGF